MNDVLDSLNERVPATLVAQHLRISRESVIRRIHRGELAGVHVAGRWYVLRSSLEDMNDARAR